MVNKNLPTLYRPCVGVMLLNKLGEVFVGQRIDKMGDFWQMPQGGIEDGEAVDVAAFRELYEETGVSESTARIIAIDEQWRRYDLPEDLIDKLWHGKYRGQEQRWVLMEFLGEDSDIRLDLHKPEFSCWRWQSVDSLPDVIVPFKRDLYIEVIGAFRDKILSYFSESQCV